MCLGPVCSRSTPHPNTFFLRHPGSHQISHGSFYPCEQILCLPQQVTRASTWKQKQVGSGQTNGLNFDLWGMCRKAFQVPVPGEIAQVSVTPEKVSTSSNSAMYTTLEGTICPKGYMNGALRSCSAQATRLFEVSLPLPGDSLVSKKSVIVPIVSDNRNGNRANNDKVKVCFCACAKSWIFHTILLLQYIP